MNFKPDRGLWIMQGMATRYSKAPGDPSHTRTYAISIATTPNHPSPLGMHNGPIIYKGRILLNIDERQVPKMKINVELTDARQFRKPRYTYEEPHAQGRETSGLVYLFPIPINEGLSSLRIVGNEIISIQTSSGSSWSRREKSTSA